MLKKLATYPSHEGYESEPYFSLWSALCHQGDVYSASYAAVPHIVRIAKINPQKAHWDCILLPASIEVARAEGRGPSVPVDLTDAYSMAIGQLPELVAGMRTAAADENLAVSAAAGVAVACGHATLAKAILELTPDVIPDFFDWLSKR